MKDLRAERNDISHYDLVKLADFYEVTPDYLLARTETKRHSNADLADPRLSDEMIDLSNRFNQKGEVQKMDDTKRWRFQVPGGLARR